MGDIEDRIPTWAGRVVSTAEFPLTTGALAPGDTEPAPSSDSAVETPQTGSVEAEVEAASGRRSRRTLVVLATVAGLLSAAVVGVVTIVGTSAPESSAPDAVERGTAGADESAAAASSLVPAAPDAATTTTTTAPEPVSAMPDVYRAEALAGGEEAWAVYVDGRIHLQGTIPDGDVADRMIARLRSMLGPDNVVADHVIDPTSPRPVDPPLFIQETVVFEPGSASIRDDSDWILGLAAVLMERYPATSLSVVADPSTAGGPAQPGELVEQRVEAIIDDLVDRGVAESRLDWRLNPGRSAGGDDTKPIEFVVGGLLRDITQAETP